MAKKRQTEEQIRAKYPFVKEGSLWYDETAGKQQVTAICPDCGIEHEQYTSDLHQCAKCEICREKDRQARKAEKKAAKAAQATVQAA